MSTQNPVTERDFRQERFCDADPADYERRPDGEIVRKDRWETSLRNIASLMRADSRKGFECDALVAAVADLIERAEKAGVAPNYPQTEE